MTKTKLAAITIAAIMVVGTLGIDPSVFAAKEDNPANGGIPNGKPFQNLDEKIEALKAEVDDIVADNDANIAALEADIAGLQSQIDDLSTDADANADAIADLENQVAILDNILGTNCGSGAIRAILSDGTVLCITVNETEIVQMTRVFAPTTSISAASFRTSIATCPSGWVATGGGFDSSRNIAEPVDSWARSSTQWQVTFEHDRDIRGFFTSSPDFVRAVASCMRVL